MSASTRRNPWTVAFPALAVVLIGCAVALTRPGPSAPTVVRAKAQPVAQVVRIVGGPRLPHSKHLDLGLDCTDCHTVTDGKVGYPKVDFCADCHSDMEDEAKTPAAQRVENVFFTPEGKPRWTKAIRSYGGDLKFSHAPHLAKEVKCADCHGKMETMQRRDAPLFTMAQCFQCHQQRKAPTDCSTCHEHMRQDVPPPDHATAWETRHGQVVLAAQAGRTQATCQYCHTQPSFCNDCHTRQMPTSHTQGWELGHGRRVLAAGGPGEARCTFCHVEQAFCDDCHMHTMPTSHKHLWLRRHGTMARAQGVSAQARCEFCHHTPAFCEGCHREMQPRDHTTLFRTRTHGLVASIDRTRCMVCHQTDFCIRCHEDTSPRSHRGQWARGHNTHCTVCHFPLDANCAVCHKGVPDHASAPPKPPGHTPGSNCRICHFPGGPGGLPHVDPGLNCELCHN